MNLLSLLIILLIHISLRILRIELSAVTEVVAEADAG